MEVLLIIPDEDLSHVKKSRDNIFYRCFMDVFCLKRCIIKEMLVIMYRRFQPEDFTTNQRSNPNNYLCIKVGVKYPCLFIREVTAEY